MISSGGIGPDVLSALFRVALATACALASWLPGWWCAGRLLPERRDAFLRLLLGAGLSTAAYLTTVNLLGRLFESSRIPGVAWLLAAAALSAWLTTFRPDEVALSPLRDTRRRWLALLAVAGALAVPQCVLAVCTPFWDEVASGAIHVTAANQFAEGTFPPRHNAFPDIPLKYHYGFTLLSGTVKWWTGLQASLAIDAASTALWLWTFLFLYCWMRHLQLGRAAAFAAAHLALLGGDLSWAVLSRLQGHASFLRVPDAATLTHAMEPARGVLENLLAFRRASNVYLEGPGGSLSNLPLDVANHYQQHAVALGLGLTLLSAFLLCRWLADPSRSRWSLLVAGSAFGLTFLGHAAFGSVASVVAGLLLLARWLRLRTAGSLVDGAAFTAAVTLLAFAHGGMLTRGAEYGSSQVHVALRDAPGYSSGGLLSFLQWNLVGVGIPLLLGLLGLSPWRGLPGPGPSRQRHVPFGFFTLFFLLSHAAPQLLAFSHGPKSREEYTEVSKFFFCSHLGLAVLAALGVQRLRRVLPGGALAAALAVLLPLASITPLATCAAGTFTEDGRWVRVHLSPYQYGKGQYHVDVGRALDRLADTGRDTYHDLSRAERTSGYLNELLVFGGSVFTTTPVRYERTGAFLIAEEEVARRTREDGRVARLHPGCAEEARCRWHYARWDEALARANVVVRSRLKAAVARGVLVERHRAGPRVLHEFVAPTTGLDGVLDQHWSPRVVTQARTDWDGDGLDDLLFHDLARDEIVVGTTRLPLPEAPEGSRRLLHVGTFPGDHLVDFHVSRMGDTVFARGQTLADMVEYSPLAWRYRDSRGRDWQPEYRRWSWDRHAPLVADLDGDGFATHLTYVTSDDRWEQAPSRLLEGPSMPASDWPIPVAGRFLPRSSGDLALWSARTGRWLVRSISIGRQREFWLGRTGDVLVPGDHDGDGRDELATWRPEDATWSVLDTRTGTIDRWSFGTPTSVPVPADYDHDGALDLAYWEPSEHRIYVSLSRGATIDLIVPVPAGAVPAFVNWY